MMNAPAARTELRRSFEAIVPLSEAVWEDLALIWERRSVQRGTMLTPVGAVERTFSFVVEGVQRVSFLTPEGEDVTVAFAYPYDYSGIPDSFFLQQPSTHALEAVTDGTVLATSHERLRAVMERHPVLDRWAWRLLAGALRGRAEREKRLMTQTARARYARFVRENAFLLQHVPLKHIASYLGMAPETLSRVRQRKG